VAVHVLSREANKIGSDLEIHLWYLQIIKYLEFQLVQNTETIFRAGKFYHIARNIILEQKKLLYKT
jgi:hypothetical protein